MCDFFNQLTIEGEAQQNDVNTRKTKKWSRVSWVNTTWEIINELWASEGSWLYKLLDVDLNDKLCRNDCVSAICCKDLLSEETQTRPSTIGGLEQYMYPQGHNNEYGQCWSTLVLYGTLA